jgi:hypothetical protein
MQEMSKCIIQRRSNTKAIYKHSQEKKWCGGVLVCDLGKYSECTGEEEVGNDTWSILSSVQTVRYGKERGIQPKAPRSSNMQPTSSYSSNGKTDIRGNENRSR